MGVTADFTVVAALVPCTGVVYAVSYGLSADVVAAFGCTLGIVPHLAAAALGLSAIVHAGARAFTVMKLVGAACRRKLKAPPCCTG